MTKEDRARIARENGAKSKGPITREGKDQSRLNSVKTGDNAEKLAQFVPPNSGILCHEDRRKFFALIGELTHIHRPVNQEAAFLVRQIAIARWQIERLQTDSNRIWNDELMDAASHPAPVFKDHEDDYFQAQVARLERRIARLRREIKLVNKEFPTVAIPMETKEEAPPEQPTTEKSEPTVYVTEPTPEVLATYRREFPNHRIVVLPPDDVANGFDFEDDLPPCTDARPEIDTSKAVSNVPVHPFTPRMFRSRLPRRRSWDSPSSALRT